LEKEGWILLMFSWTLLISLRILKTKGYKRGKRTQREREKGEERRVIGRKANKQKNKEGEEVVLAVGWVFHCP
jgi:hypothetical protein